MAGPGSSMDYYCADCPVLSSDSAALSPDSECGVLVDRYAALAPGSLVTVGLSGESGEPTTNLSPLQRSMAEQWLLRRGVPHLVADYTARDRIWTRARPLLIIAFVLQVFLSFGDRFSGWTQAVVFAAALTLAASAVYGFRRWRGFSPFDTRGGVTWQQLVFFVAVPTVLSGIGGNGWLAMAGVMVANLVFLLVVYVVVGFGLLPLSRWAVELMATRFLSLNRMLARTLPVVLVLTVFMFINAEIWQVAVLADWRALALACVLLAAIGVAFVAISAADIVADARRAVLDDMAAESDQFSDYLVGTPLEGCQPHGDELDLDLGARANLRLVVVFSLGAPILFLVALIAATYVGFGFVLVPLEVLQTWGGPDADYTIVFDTAVFDRRITLTIEHLAVSALVATLSGLSVAASAVSDEAHVKDFTERLHRELRQNLVVARTYRGLLKAGADQPGG